jgi:hypothetical protein
MRETQAERKSHSELVPLFRLNFDAEKKQRVIQALQTKKPLV